MKKRNIIVALSALAALLLVVGAASAAMGKYADLVAYREESGLSIMPMATDEQSFQDMQEMHKTMEKFHDKYGSGMGKGMGGMRGMMGANMGSGCQMMD